jgi:hypothetical protein
MKGVFVAIFILTGRLQVDTSLRENPDKDASCLERTSRGFRGNLYPNGEIATQYVIARKPGQRCFLFRKNIKGVFVAIFILTGRLQVDTSLRENPDKDASCLERTSKGFFSRGSCPRTI